MVQQQEKIERDGQDFIDDGPVTADTQGPRGAQVSVLEQTAYEKPESTKNVIGKTQGELDEHAGTDNVASNVQNIETEEYKEMKDKIVTLKKENKVLKAFEKGVKQGLQ